MSEQLRIGGTTTRRRRGASRCMVDRTLLAWRKAATLAGDEHAATRSALRDAAEAVDAARDALRSAREHAPATVAAMEDVSRSANRLGECARRLAEMIDAVVPLRGEASNGDAFDVLLRDLSNPALRD